MIKFFFPILEHMCLLFLQIAHCRWVSFGPDWVSFCPEYHPQTVLYLGVLEWQAQTQGVSKFASVAAGSNLLA